MAHEGPSRNRPLYNRRRTTCEFRGATIPEELLLTPEQQVALDRMKEDDSKHRPSFGSGGDRGSWIDADGVWLDLGDFGGGGE